MIGRESVRFDQNRIIVRVLDSGVCTELVSLSHQAIDKIIKDRILFRDFQSYYVLDPFGCHVIRLFLVYSRTGSIIAQGNTRRAAV